jgi:hypothetical protein
MLPFILKVEDLQNEESLKAFYELLAHSQGFSQSTDNLIEKILESIFMYKMLNDHRWLVKFRDNQISLNNVINNNRTMKEFLNQMFE